MRRINIKNITAAILSTVLVLVFWRPFISHADTKTVRVGWYESPFNIIDETGRRSGYAYEYQRKIAAYTGRQYDTLFDNDKGNGCRSVIRYAFGTQLLCHGRYKGHLR